MIIPAKDFSLSDTLASGQTFCWEDTSDNIWSGWIDEVPTRLKQEQDKVIVLEGPEEKSRIIHYLGMNDDPIELLSPYLEDPHLALALQKTRGLRCIQDPHWECTANFICSSLKQIPHIAAINQKLRSEFGIAVKGHGKMRFPHFSIIASLQESDLRECRLGYRAKFLLNTARAWDSGDFDPKAIEGMDTSEASAYLQTLPGVGEKVAHCILLYAWRRWDTFPIDVWIQRIMQKLYFPRRTRTPPSPKMIHRKSKALFGAHRGLAQLYLFHYGRTHFQYK